MGTANVWILGGYQSDFARDLTREDHDFADLTAEVVDNTLAAARVDATDIEVVHVANAFGEMFARVGHLGAMQYRTVGLGLQQKLDRAAGDYQVEGAKTFGTLNFGGSTATTVSFIVSVV
jgi:hypothetical protein